MPIAFVIARRGKADGRRRRRTVSKHRAPSPKPQAGSPQRTRRAQRFKTEKGLFAAKRHSAAQRSGRGELAATPAPCSAMAPREGVWIEFSNHKPAARLWAPLRQPSPSDFLRLLAAKPGLGPVGDRTYLLQSSMRWIGMRAWLRMVRWIAAKRHSARSGRGNARRARAAQWHCEREFGLSSQTTNPPRAYGRLYGSLRPPIFCAFLRLNPAWVRSATEPTCSSQACAGSG